MPRVVCKINNFKNLEMMRNATLACKKNRYVLHVFLKNRNWRF